MEAIEIVEGLVGYANRGAGTDAERRAAAWLASELSRDGQDAVIETFWCRPNWAMANTVHAALAVAGSLVSLASPVAGVAILAATLVSILADSFTGSSLGRRFTHERASQNVTWLPSGTSGDERRVRLILTANYDAGRAGLAYQDWLRRPVTSARMAFGGNTPGWLGWLAIATAWLLVIAILRSAGHTSHAIGAAQLPPTVGLLIGFALLLDLAGSGWSPSAGDNATGVALATALAKALQSAPPQHVGAELVLTGAGDRDQIGLRRHLRRHRTERTRTNTVVLGIAPCASGAPRWWLSDGSLLPLRYGRPLRELAGQLAAEEPHLHVTPYRGRGSSPAFPAREAGIPAIALGCLDDHGLPARSHQQADTLAAIDPSALDAALQFALLMIDAIDTTVGELQGEPTATPA